MGEIIVKTSEEIQNVDFPTLSTYGDILNAPTSIAEIDKIAAAILAELEASNLKFIGGTIQTTDENPAVVSLLSVTEAEPLYFMAKIKAINTATGDHGSFERNVTVKNVGGTITVSQVQDAFTIRDQDYDVDFTESGGVVQLRVYGLSGHTVNWTYSVIILN